MAGGGTLGTDTWGELFTDGGMVSTAPDVARFLDTLLVERRLMRPRTLRRMLTPGPDGDYGLGLTRYRVGSCVFWGHGGFWAGWSTGAGTERTSGTTIVVLLREAGPNDSYATATALANVLGRHGVLPCP